MATESMVTGETQERRVSPGMKAERVFTVARKEFTDQVTGWRFLVILALFLAIALVGTRHATTYGREVTQLLATQLAHQGITIVSGMARGVDALAHQAALDVGGRTIAVLGCGVDVIYPPEHRKLAEAIIANGALLSDYAPGTPPDGVNFPPRNRIISGLSRATIVIEAGEKSGALITAKFSAEQGRDVFAVPGSILSPMSRGTNNLIAEGATPLTNPKDVLVALNYTQVAEKQSARATRQPNPP